MSTYLSFISLSLFSLMYLSLYLCEQTEVKVIQTALLCWTGGMGEVRSGFVEARGSLSILTLFTHLLRISSYQQLGLLAAKCKPSIVIFFFCCRKQTLSSRRNSLKIIQAKAQIKPQKLNTEIIFTA